MSSSPCPLPIKSLSSIKKSAKVSGQLLLQESADPYVSEAKVLLKSGNWSASEAVEEAKKRLNFKQILGYHQCHRAGFGSISIPEVPPKHSYAYRKLLTSMVEEAEEEKYQAKAVQLSVQGQWTKWCSYVCMDLSWKTLLAMPQQLLSNSIQTALNSSLGTETLSGDNSIYCNFCCSLKSASVVPAFLEVGRYLVIQLKRFVSHDNQVLIDMKHVQCTPNISVPVKDNEVTFHKHYHLIATINHTGSLTRGHYTAFIKIPNSKSWLHCNDAAVLRANENKVNNTSSYIYFYESH